MTDEQSSTACHMTHHDWAPETRPHHLLFCLLQQCSQGVLLLLQLLELSVMLYLRFRTQSAIVAVKLQSTKGGCNK